MVNYASVSAIEKLQTIQNSALRIATGCLMMSSIDHLHMEAEIMMVGEHLKMLCAQFLATCLQPQHPPFPIVTADSGPRNMKNTLRTFSITEVADFMEDGASKDIHTTSVRRSIEAGGENRILGIPALAVNEEEEQLPRKTRRTLAQLSSGFFSSLNGYNHRVGQSDRQIFP